MSDDCAWDQVEDVDCTRKLGRGHSLSTTVAGYAMIMLMYLLSVGQKLLRVLYIGLNRRSRYRLEGHLHIRCRHCLMMQLQLYNKDRDQFVLDASVKNRDKMIKCTSSTPHHCWTAK